MSEVEAYSRLAGVYDEIVVDPCFALWATYLDTAWTGDPDGVHRVLDVCCGTGLMAAELLELGYQVVGVDASEAMLERARQLLGARAELSRQTLPDLEVDGTFDAAISTFDGLNYLTLADFRASMRRIANVLRPHGWLVFDLHTDAMLALAGANPTVAGEADGNSYAITNVVDMRSRTCEAAIVVSRDGDSFTERHLQYFHADEEVRSALSDAGFSVTTVAHEYSDQPVSGSTLRATWVVRRAST